MFQNGKEFTDMQQVLEDMKKYYDSEIQALVVANGAIAVDKNQ